MASRITSRPTTLAETFSFYVPSTDTATLQVVESLADAVTVKGPNGPEVIRGLRAGGWDTPVIFDRSGYDPRTAPIDPERWFDDQASAGADRLLSAGTWLGWIPSGDSLQQAVDTEAVRCESHPDATAVFAVDHRWLTRTPMELADALGALGHPAALVLAHPTDPLSPANAVQGLIALTRTVEDLSILRTDHGGFGALVYGACHAAVGLIGSYRHFVPPGKTGGGKTDDASPRVFVGPLMDWFTGLTIAGWATAKVNLRCPLACCGGQRLDRFFDPKYKAEAESHNRVSLSRLADDILNAPREERRQRFSQLCLDALDHYGPMGKLSMVTKPKRQLSQWTFT
jgi:hypothetical protein